MSGSAGPGDAGSASAFAVAEAKSLLHLQLAVLALATVHDSSSRLLARAVTLSGRSKETHQVLAECLTWARAANENIEQAEKLMIDDTGVAQLTANVRKVFVDSRGLQHGADSVNLKLIERGMC